MATVLKGTEVLSVLGAQPNGMVCAQSEQTTTNAIANLNLSGAVATTLTNTIGFTLTAAQVGGVASVAIILSGTLADDANVALPTVAALATLLPVPAANAAGWNIKIANASSADFGWTVTTNTGWTLSGTMTIPQSTTRSFVAKFASATAATLTTTGTGTYS